MVETARARRENMALTDRTSDRSPEVKPSLPSRPTRVPQEATIETDGTGRPEGAEFLHGVGVCGH